VAATHDLSAWKVTLLPVDSEKVSAQHALVGCDPDGAWVIDLGSRNGTSLRMRPHSAEPLALGDVVLDLATQSPDAGSDRPHAPGWVGADDFAERVTESLNAWFVECGVPVGFALDTDAPDVTADTRLPALLDVAAAYVDEQNALLDQERGHGDDLVIRSPRFREAHRRVYDASVRGRRLLLLGASGTGKERLARCYHQHSSRRDGPFRALNCALMDKELIWVQLFGAARGARCGGARPRRDALPRRGGRARAAGAGVAAEVPGPARGVRAAG